MGLTARVGLLAIALPLQAVAALGGQASTVATDQTAMKATRVEKAHADFNVQTLTMPHGTVVREFVSTASGRVFAVTWRGPFMPDLRVLLGRYFEGFVEAGHGSGRGPVLVQQPGVVIHSGGRMRAFVGMAYVPDLLPPGVSLDDMR